MSRAGHAGGNDRDGPAGHTACGSDASHDDRVDDQSSCADLAGCSSRADGSVCAARGSDDSRVGAIV